jgi:hypothetical protein
LEGTDKWAAATAVGSGLRNGLCFALLLKFQGEIKRGEIGMLWVWELYVLASDAENIGFLPDVLVLLLFKFE